LINGIINVYKEKGYTSHDVVAKLRGILKQKKIGHTGTLDPDAEGVLPVCLGNATKLCDILTDRSKTYQAVLLLGTTTDTQDITGTVLSEKPVTAGEEEIRQAIMSFQGYYDQIPPMYSALKIGGKRLYELAREGIEVPREARKVEIHSIEIEDLNVLTGQAILTVDCSKGTYIRTLCHDIGEQLGCGGCMKSLLRTRAGEFQMNKSLKISEIADKINEGNLDEYIRKADEMFAGYPSVNVKQEFDKLLYNGNFLSADQLVQGEAGISSEERIRVYDWHGTFVGLYEGHPAEKIMKPYKMFL
jgi:tRNA pseudouridine55 synthase